jgi:transposase
VSACTRIVVDGQVAREVRTFGTSTRELSEMADWLASVGCTHVAMESTGVYWKPVWHVLEGRFELVLANAMHVRNIPGRKSDVKDAVWIADLLAHGLLRGSFVPPEEVQELRDLTRTRKQLVREIGRHTLRIQKTLEDANVKLTEVTSDILGKSGRAILRALIAGETDPERLIDLTRDRLKASRASLKDALQGRISEHHRFMLRMHLDQLEYLEAAVRDLEARAGQQPFRAATKLLTTIPGVSNITARVIVAEIGDDMSRFPTAGNLVSCFTWTVILHHLDHSHPYQGAPAGRLHGVLRPRRPRRGPQGHLLRGSPGGGGQRDAPGPRREDRRDRFGDRPPGRLAMTGAGPAWRPFPWRKICVHATSRGFKNVEVLCKQ